MYHTSSKTHPVVNDDDDDEDDSNNSFIFRLKSRNFEGKVSQLYLLQYLDTVTIILPLYSQYILVI